MQAAEIVRLANALDLRDENSTLLFARMLAEHCAQIVEECPPNFSIDQAAAAIRVLFKVEHKRRLGEGVHY
jgi:hypothetical protein